MNWNPKPYIRAENHRATACFSVDVDATSPWLWEHRKKPPNTIAAHEHRQYGMRKGLARMVTMLDRIGVQGSFFVPGVVAQDNPDLLPGLLDRGHEIALHGYYHEIVSETSDAQFSDALGQSIDLFVAQTGQRPKGFRSPAWELTSHMLRELKSASLWDSSLMGNDTPYCIDGVTELPVRWENDDAVFFKFLGVGGNVPHPEYDVERRWLDETTSQIRDGGLFMLTVHDWISGRTARVDMLERIFQQLIDNDQVWIATCSQIADHHIKTKQGLDVTSDTITLANKKEKNVG